MNSTFIFIAFLTLQYDKPIQPGVVEQRGDVRIFVEPAPRVIDSNGAIVAKASRGYVMVNDNKLQRVVATYKMSPSNRVLMTDLSGTQDDLVEREYTVLLQPGQSVDLLDEITGGFIRDANGFTRQQVAATLSYQLIGYYIPEANLKDLDNGLAEDHLRLQPVRNEQYSSQSCKRPNSPNVHILYNLNPTKKITAKVDWLTMGGLNHTQNLYLNNLSWLPFNCNIIDLDSLKLSNVRYSN